MVDVAMIATTKQCPASRRSLFSSFVGPRKDYSGYGLQRLLHAMTALQSTPASRNRPDGHWSDDDYNVVLMDTGKPVGRIFRRTVAPGTLM